jgi:hypothetical protein
MMVLYVHCLLVAYSCKFVCTLLVSCIMVVKNSYLNLEYEH